MKSVLLLVLIFLLINNSIISDIHQNVNLDVLLRRINRTIDSVVDANIGQLLSVYHKGNLCPFRKKVYNKLVYNKDINILIIGGSVTYGAELPDRLNQRWSHVFSNILASGWYRGNININNIGAGACNVDVWIDRVHEMEGADIVLVDLTVNDQTYDLRLLPHLYRQLIQGIDSLPNHPALLFHQAFRIGLYSLEELNHCPVPSEQGKCCSSEHGDVVYCTRWWYMQDYVAIPMEKFGTPYISYRDLVWPVYDEPPDNLNVFWNGKSHPDAKAHALIGKIMAFAFYMQILEAHHAEHCDADDEGQWGGRYVSADDFDDTLQPICTAPLSKMWANDSAVSRSNFQLVDPSWIKEDNGTTIGWRYYADSKSKYGWILHMSQKEVDDICVPEGIEPGKFCDAAQNKTVLSIPIVLGDPPRLQISYLISYAEMGNVRVWIDEERHVGERIAGLWYEHFSITQVVTFVGQSESDYAESISNSAAKDIRVLTSMSPGPHTLHVSAARIKTGTASKFKLIGVTSC